MAFIFKASFSLVIIILVILVSCHLLRLEDFSRRLGDMRRPLVSIIGSDYLKSCYDVHTQSYTRKSIYGVFVAVRRNNAAFLQIK